MQKYKKNFKLALFLKYFIYLCTQKEIYGAVFGHTYI